MHILIIGNGIAGITAARHLRKLGNDKITVVSKETDYFFSRTALMYLYMGHMRFKDVQPYAPDFWKKNRIDLIRGEVKEIDFDKKQLVFNADFKAEDSELGEAPAKITYDKLILALGSASNKFGWPGQDLKRVQGLYSFQDVQGMEQHSESLTRAVVVGGGLIGIEMAEMFHSRHIPVTLLVREESYWDMVLPSEESEMVGKHILSHGIDLRFATELKEIIGNDQGEAVGIVTKAGEEIKCEFVGLTAGVHPNVRWLKESELEVDRGILINENLQTNIPDVYAIGDCAQLRNPLKGRRNIEAVWYTGRMMGEVAAHNIMGHQVSYDPGLWFNSAKFLDIEYQVYGEVPVKLPAQMASVFWSDMEQRSIRILYDKGSEKVLGFNLMGIRFRHEVCEKWINDGAGIREVLANLSLANFDPEFYTSYEPELVQEYERTSNNKIKQNRGSSLDRVLAFLRS